MLRYTLPVPNRLLSKFTQHQFVDIHIQNCLRTKLYTTTRAPLPDREFTNMTTSTPTSSLNNPNLVAPLHGACHCQKTTYTLTAPPIRINACHCRDCQIKSGTAFLTNLLIERSHVQLTSSTEVFTKPHRPGIDITRCPECYVTLWSTIPSLGPDIVLVRVGTLEKCSDVVPDVHFFTRSKVGWVNIPDGVKRFEGGKPDDEPGFWTDESRRRVEKTLGRKVV